MTYVDGKEVKNKVIVPENADIMPIHATVSRDYKHVVISASDDKILVGKKLEIKGEK